MKDISTLRPAPGTEFQGGSQCDSQTGREAHICKVFQDAQQSILGHPWVNMLR